MTDELIRRSDAIEAVKAYLDLCCLTEAKFHRGMEDYNEEISTEIFEKIEPKRGEWIVYEGEWKDFDYYPPKCKCNQCGYEEDLYILNAKPTDFCPNCGADMRGADQ